jgi:CheY-like chemotaxis protein
VPGLGGAAADLAEDVPKSENPRHMSPAVPASNASTRPFSLLLVEDDADHAELVLRCLAEHLPEATVRHVSDGQAALDYLMSGGAPASSQALPDLILLDLRLPLVDGLAVLAEIKADERLRNVPVVILTTSDAERDLTRAYAAHANSYLVKPMDFEKFDSLVRDLGFYWIGWNRHP